METHCDFFDVGIKFLNIIDGFFGASDVTGSGRGVFLKIGRVSVHYVRLAHDRGQWRR